MGTSKVSWEALRGLPSKPYPPARARVRAKQYYCAFRIDMEDDSTSHVALDVQVDEPSPSGAAESACRRGPAAAAGVNLPKHDVALRVEELGTRQMKGILALGFVGGSLGLFAAVAVNVYVRRQVCP